MEDFHYELGVTSHDTLDFFFSSLKEEVYGRDVRADDLLYVASVLAHFAQTSCSNSSDPASDQSLTGVFDRFVMERRTIPNNSELLEFGASQSLFIVGFFREQVRRRHSVSLFDEIGRGLYVEASSLSRERRRREMLYRMSVSFKMWAQVCRDLHLTMRKFQPVPYRLNLD